ncbi:MULTISPECIES: nucleoside/nucleotide kinase family protein [unclassified Cryobacterium]|uniref:nucleoside/nucleotide kinase family protein n=1 Tax=unclassified Cryobacterium TaxID=2649013 RepID=UPI002AB53E2F|nr:MULTISPECIES: nucleoside/nucleotide kinase family protein [unclassified Cryobacterium]MDY7541121.1 nucleoside/nucleotide kinase family protein [Cryobacterium sp. 5B3]MEA9999920.1 nucleoside/nucleotide kinase family protein [Cryobacterium sp. RTS3]MEB0266285.1 nucleoside/nucleotide kinase family protein [Cryobacterium sp. 10I5]MEB0275293.1 nucleoside/nucleotide kinase family protein [Cryobacterium sp. 5B3]
MTSDASREPGSSRFSRPSAESLDPKIPPVIEATVDELAARVRRMLAGSAKVAPRIMLGLCGAPGSGKSTLAAALVERLGAETAVIVPMDGFHLATDLIRGTPLAERRGAIDTFDPGSYLSLLRRLRARDEDVVYAPSFRRGLEEPIAASIAVPRSVPVVITEGNYLLTDAPVWLELRGELDAVWYVDTPDAVRLPRLIGRHVQFGRDEADAAAFAGGSDQANADLINRTRERADLILRLLD